MYPTKKLFLSFFKDLFLYLWLCWVFIALYRLSLVAINGVNSLVVVCGLLIAVSSFAAKHRF